MEPRVTKRERKLQLAYDLPHRIRCAQLYPAPAPNGSTLLLYCHDQGVKILWRGGRRPKQPAAPQPAPSAAPPRTRSQTKDVVVLDDSEDEEAVEKEQADYEDEEDEMDLDTPYPRIIQEMDLKLGSPALHLAVPAVSPQASQRPAVVKQHAIFAVHTADGKIHLLQVLLAPPFATRSRDAVEKILSDKIELPAGKVMLEDISVKVLTRFRETLQASEPEYTICVAAVSDALRLWRLPTNAAEIIVEETTLQRLPLPSNATKVSYHPMTSWAQTLIVDAQNAVRIYDPSTPKDPNARPSSSDSYISGNEVGKWVMTFQAPFHAVSQDHPAIPARKKILDAKWILNGRAVIALLEDGEWGIWDVSASTQNNKIGDFALNGFLGSAGVAAPAELGNQRKGGSKLAPMTPNTRKTKSQAFLKGTSKAPGAVSKGGITVASTDNTTGQPDESIMLWYESEVYSIPNVQQFWQRSLNSSNNSGLYAPGLSHITDVNLMNESITSISQFSAKPSSSGLGQMNTPRDFLISAEHRFIIHQATRPPVPSSRSFVEKAAAAASAASNDRDQRMLDAGELDIGGMDRMLDSMANGGATRTRRVGFAAS